MQVRDKNLVIISTVEKGAEAFSLTSPLVLKIKTYSLLGVFSWNWVCRSFSMVFVTVAYVKSLLFSEHYGLLRILLFLRMCLCNKKVLEDNQKLKNITESNIKVGGAEFMIFPLSHHRLLPPLGFYWRKQNIQDGCLRNTMVFIEYNIFICNQIR